MEQPAEKPESIASWLGINRATMAIMVATCGLGLSEEIWHNFLGIELHSKTDDVLYLAIFSLILNLLEGFGYIIGGTLAHKMGARIALAVSALPTAVGFAAMLLWPSPAVLVFGALMMTNWEPLSVPATFDVIGGEVPKNRRTIAFAMQSIQKRIPKVLGPIIGGLAIATGYWLNLTLSFAILGVSIVLQMALLRNLKPKPDPSPVPLKKVLAEMPPDLRRLLSAEILLRWGDWFVRDFAAVYIVTQFGLSKQTAGYLLSLQGLSALLTYIPVSKMVDNARSPKPFIGITFFLFALFPFCLVLLPKTGLPLMAALSIAFIVNGLRELGEPARKAMIASGFPPEVRARAVGLYWGLRSFAFFPAPIVAYLLWHYISPDAAFLIGGTIGMIGTVWFWLRVRCEPHA